MLLIDRVIKIRTDYSGIGIKNVTFNELPFLGHFPERPVYPGVMMIEAMAQTAGVIGIKSVEGTKKPRAVYFLTIDKCKFRKPVMPGDTIEYHMRSIGRRKTIDRKSTRLNSSHLVISYAVFCLKKKERKPVRKAGAAYACNQVNVKRCFRSSSAWRLRPSLHRLPPFRFCSLPVLDHAAVRADTA